MATDIGPKIGLDGEKEFRAALQSMGQQLKTLDTEMRAVTSAFSANDRSQAALSAQSDVLTKKLSTQEARLAEIQKALDYARANYAENSNEVQRWQQALNNATADVNKTKKEIEHLGDETQETGEKVSIFGDVLKANLASEAIISGVKALSGAIKSLIGGAVENYGDFEQLVGGVETLFKDSAGIVQNYAKDAYKTAGLSANDYMETVTSFSASLLQSMGNDTQAAAKKADLAITDMADNANKMGTDMQSIQNAYQGFAKQNYTMLDNLKLGYGGTKEEMQRLINDANALNAAQGNYTNYTIESYADIVDAIHTVQTEMGITGTTALESSTTIEGSIASMKAAWTNFVTGLANDNADIAKLSQELIKSVETVASNVLPVIETVLTNIAEAVKNDGPEMIEKFVAYALEKLPDIISLGLQMVLALVAGLAQNLPQLVSGVLRMVETIVSTFVASLPDIIDVGKDIVRGLWEGIKEMGAWLKEKVSDFVGGIVSNVKGFLGIHSPSTVFAGIGENMALGLGKGFTAEMQGVSANIQDAIPTPAVDAVYNAAAGMVNGLAAANAGNGGGSYTINLLLQNGQQIASWLLPDLRDAARNNPEVARA